MIVGHGVSVGIMTNLDMMLSMIMRYPINLGRIVTKLIAQQGKNPKLGTIFADPFITRLVQGMNLLDRI